MIVQNIFAATLLIGGLFFLSISGIGLIRLPDFYSRNHAVGKSETLGSILVLCGLVVYNGIDINSLKLILILFFITIANPTATHIVARAAYHSGLQPWFRNGTQKQQSDRQHERQ